MPADLRPPVSVARPRVSVACVLAAFVAAGVATAGIAGAGTGRAQTREVIPSFDRVVVVVFENKEFDRVIGSPDAPTFRSLARRYALMTNYRAVAHPSLPNYLAMVSGSSQGIASDCTSCQVSAPNLADALERAGMTWKTYAEGLPRAGFTGAKAGRYAKKHNPLVYFTDVVSSPDRLRRIVPLRSFARDLGAGRLPDFSLVVPDLCHDMHDCSVAAGDAWLRVFLRPLLGHSGTGSSSSWSTRASRTKGVAVMSLHSSSGRSFAPDHAPRCRSTTTRYCGRSRAVGAYPFWDGPAAHGRSRASGASAPSFSSGVLPSIRRSVALTEGRDPRVMVAVPERLCRQSGCPGLVTRCVW